MATHTRQQSVERVTIPSGQYTHSTAINLTTKLPIAILIPGEWTAAAISFSGSAFSLDPNVGYAWLSSASGKIYKISTVQANGQYELRGSAFRATNYLYIVSGDLALGAGGLVNQAADRQLIIICEDRDPVTIQGA